jgi:hypothetical protein
VDRCACERGDDVNSGALIEDTVLIGLTMSTRRKITKYTRTAKPNRPAKPQNIHGQRTIIIDTTKLTLFYESRAMFSSDRKREGTYIHISVIKLSLAEPQS